ncbi:MAG: mechanosensitive ion channel [Verrucomicrobiota bacterium JB024]|nr:mechanosensitive ion channel [Verrucomicrobiota bacterium JB024]
MGMRSAVPAHSQAPTLTRLRPLWRCLFFTVCWSFAVVSLQAQEPGQPATPPATGTDQSSAAPGVVTAEYLQGLEEDYPAPKDNEPASSDFKLIQDAKASLDQAQQYKVQLNDLEKVISAALADTQALKEQTTLVKNTPDPALPDSLADAESLLSQLKSKQDALNTQVQDLKARIGKFSEEKLTASTQVNEIRARINDLSKTQGGSETEKAARQARIQQLQAQLDLLERQTATSDLRRGYRVAQRELAEAQQTSQARQIETLGAHVEQLRKEALTRQEEEAREATRQAAMQDPVLKELAKQNQSWIAMRRELTGQIEKQNQQLTYYTEVTQDTQARLEKIEQRLSIAGHSQSVGALLHRELRALPDTEKLENEQDDLNDHVREVQLDLIDLEQERDKASDTNQAMATYRQQLPAAKSPQEGALRERLLRELLAQRVEILSGLISDTDDYFESIVATAAAVGTAITAVESFEEFTAENALWIPDRNHLSDEDFLILPGILNDIAHRTGQMISNIFTQGLERLAVIILGTLLLVLVARRIGRSLDRLRQRPLSEAQFPDTLLLLAYEIALAFIPVLVLLGIAWTVDIPAIENSWESTVGTARNSFADAIAMTCLGLIPATISLTLLYRLSLPGGLGDVQFRWNDQSCRVINSTVRWVMLPAYALSFIATFLSSYGVIYDQNTGSRVLFLGALILLIVAFQRVFHPEKGIFSDSGMRFGLFRHAFLRWSVYILLVGWITMLAVMISLGYMAGVMAMVRTTVHTLWLLAGIAVLDGLLSRYLRIHRYQAIVQQRAKDAEKAAAERATDGGNEAVPPVEEGNPNWREIDPQIRHILNLLRVVIFIIGVAFIWHDALPAFRTISDFALIGDSASPMLTVGQLVMLGVCLITTLVLAKNLPTIIELVIFRRMESISQGNRHAFATLVAYFIVLCGVIWASVIAEVEWSKVQWLIAAMSVGLGFGLQEIFGNLVAGIILLFERPIRVGDIVTIDDTTGSIARIRIRGTTIREFDRREVIVPNKTIITGKLINWTLSDTMTRLKIPVGVAYGTDTEKVIIILKEILASTPNVLSDPEPRVFFTEMADSSLNFICFAYLSSMDFRLDTQSAINHAIVKRFAAESIEIPFPQRTLHIVREGEKDS